MKPALLYVVILLLLRLQPQPVANGCRDAFGAARCGGTDQAAAMTCSTTTTRQRQRQQQQRSSRCHRPPTRAHSPLPTLMLPYSAGHHREILAAGADEFSRHHRGILAVTTTRKGAPEGGEASLS
ncbi:hypothetical protein OPV22_031867 [Ensete ventricosum]|uniref:Secreted protein n=1 Tax=Ensete ventricosum TaxID=4639 RepID=A0AAV8PLK0_ENSVE|nr:hypothetical protein OPV22_031867 [Ensete ventricosum]